MLLSYLAVNEAMSWNWQESAAMSQEHRSFAVIQFKLNPLRLMTWGQ